MASRDADLEERIVQLLKKEAKTLIVLTGAAGVGKTWIAKKISDRLISEGSSYMALWVFQNQQAFSKKDQTESSSKETKPSPLHENIARQLSVLSTVEEWDDNISKEEEQDHEEKSLESLKKKISEKIDKMRAATPKFLLLILDGVPDDTTSEVNILTELEALLDLNEKTPYKVLITTRRSKEPVKEASEIQSKEMEQQVIEILPFSEEAGLTLFQESVTEKVKKMVVFKKRAGEIAKKSKGLPAAINIIAGAFNRIGELDSGILTLEGALEEAATCEELAPDHGVNPLLRCAYHMLLRSTDRALINCWWHSLHFFSKHGGVHFNELIAYWILEGYLDPVELVEKAYEKGHRILIELIDRHMLKIQDGNNVVAEGLTLLSVPDCGRDGYEGTSSLGLESVVFEDGGDWQGFGKITPAYGMMKTLCNPAKWDKVSTLLIDGNRLRREGPADKFFYKIILKGLRILALLSPASKTLMPSSSWSTMGELRLLVLRGCDLLEKIDTIKELKSLTVLEISGATSLTKDVPDDFFKKMSKLRSLNLSAAQIKSLPSSISDLIELRWLILRGCSSLKTLPRLKKLTKLEVLDLSGAIKLETFEDVALKSLANLRRLDVSRTKISRLPILGKLENLTTLELRGCEHLARLPKLRGLPNLQALDLSGAVMLKEIQDESLQNKTSLKILHLSQTSIPLFPSNLAGLSHLELLDLSGATNLVKLEDKTFEKLSCLRHLDLSKTKIENLPSLSNLDNLQLLNLSGCSALTKIADQSFDHMTRLQRLQLSETKIEFLPSLSKHVNLRQLLLRSCTSLKQLPSLESQSKLEELDLSGAQLLKETNVDFLKNMNNLQLLNLSGTGLPLPSLSNLTNLTQLSLRGCSLSESEPNFGVHKKLEVMDLSETQITSLPSLGNLTSLRELKLRGCSGLKELPDLNSLIHLEVLDLWGTGIKGFPYEISELTSLKHVGLPDMTGVEKIEWDRIKRLPEEVNWAECGILKHCKNGPCVSMSATQLSGILKEHPDQLANLDKFHLSVSAPLKEEGGARDIDWHRIDPSLRNIYLQKFSVPEEGARFLEIVGFDRFPDGIEGAIVKAEYIALIRNKFMKSLSDLAAGLKAANVGVKAMKGCILERCTEMETIFGVVEENLETLRASNLPKLKSVVSSGNVQLGGFQNLKELYLDCCPVLEVVFLSSQQPENLEILKIKFCDKLKTLFNSEPQTECKLQKLRKLHLMELPVLTTIGVAESKTASNVPELKQTVQLGGFQNLKELYLDRCPALEVVFHSSQLPKNLEILEIKWCDKLKTLFNSEPQTECKLQKLRKLHLMELPVLTTIGVAESKTASNVPELKQTVQLGGFQNLKELYLDRCPALEVVFHSSHLPENLEILEIKRCDKLKTLFHSDSPSEYKLQKLKKLHLVELPELTSIGPIPQRSVSIEVTKCPKIQN
ncbi:putative disease resistance protein At4g19050 [Corylus avellana]|uniref:putative disease resistance protein At4g19050 n=1 Tax=Corylus avellana TaxID=13451 RepID=UPI00286D2347|nr:putative disease resistance protein At4g19050 [Corylus avellana]